MDKYMDCDIEDSSVISVEYGIIFYEKNGQKHQYYIFDLKSFCQQLPTALKDSLCLLSHNHDDYLCQIMDDNEKPGVFLGQTEMVDDGDYDYEDNYISNNVEYTKYIRIHYEPISGKEFKLRHILSIDITDLISLLDKEWVNQFQKIRKNRTKKAQRELERLDNNLKILQSDWYTDENGLRNVTALVINKCQLTDEEKETLRR